MRAETSTHSANCAADRRDSSGAALGPVLDMLVTVQSGAQFACQDCRHLCRGAEAVSLGPCQKTLEILQLQFIDKVFDVCCAGPASSGAVGEETVELPQVQPVEHGHYSCHARRCAATGARWFRRQKTVKVPQLQYI